MNDLKYNENNSNSNSNSSSSSSGGGSGRKSDEFHNTIIRINEIQLIYKSSYIVFLVSSHSESLLLHALQLQVCCGNVRIIPISCKCGCAVYVYYI